MDYNFRYGFEKTAGVEYGLEAYRTHPKKLAPILSDTSKYIDLMDEDHPSVRNYVKPTHSAFGGKHISSAITGEAPYDDGSAYDGKPPNVLNRHQALKAIKHLKGRLSVDAAVKMQDSARSYDSGPNKRAPVSDIERQGYSKSLGAFIRDSEKHIRNKKNKSFRFRWS